MTETATARAAAPLPFSAETVLWVKHWTDSLFSFAITRPGSFRFRSGEFVMIGLAGTPKAVMRAYSIASSSFAEDLEFLSIKVENGPLTSRLCHIRPGDEVLLGRKSTGTLVLDALKPGRRLFLFGTGTGLAPFLSVVRDPETYARFDQVLIGHSVREVAELAYGDLLTRDLFDDPLVGEEAASQLIYYPTVTREPFERRGRFTDLIGTGALFSDIGGSAGRFDPDQDRVMLCGSMAFIRDMAALLDGHGMTEGSNAAPGTYVLERAFVG